MGQEHHTERMDSPVQESQEDDQETDGDRRSTGLHREDLHKVNDGLHDVHNTPQHLQTTTTAELLWTEDKTMRTVLM